MSGLTAALWLLGLYAAAPVLRSDARYAFADRIRDALILGVAIPLGLGLVHALYPSACWIVLIVAIAAAAWRDRARSATTTLGAGARPPYLLVGGLALVAWPQLIRPLLEGDSLSYHLPNAAAWVQAHSIWTTATRYWWYPPASEIFASALYATSGPFALPWAGFGALLLLGLRVNLWARAASASPLLADALAAATVTAYPVAIQAGTLQNDVWLAAFFLESLWLLRASSNASIRTLAVTALIKPQGWMLAALALIAMRGRRNAWLAAGAAFGLWMLHDAILWQRAVVAPATTMYGSLAGSSILAHGLPALLLLGRVTLVASPFALAAIFTALAGPLVARRDGTGWAACVAALLVVALPFGYATSVAQLATGASLRLAIPAIAAGAALLARPARRAVFAATVLLVASTVFGCSQVIATFWNDAPTRTALAVAPLAAAIVWWAHASQRRWPVTVGFAAAALAAGLLATRYTVDFYADAFRIGNRTTGVYAWLAAHRPPAVGAWGLALGTVNVLAPLTRTIELPERGACARAQREHVLLVAVSENDRTAEFNAARLRAARGCGRTAYDDGLAVVSGLF